MKTIRRLIRLAVVATIIAAVLEQLRRPPEERTWFGKVGGVVPYDFRMPTIGRIRASMWNPGSDRIITDTAFGVGWTVNLAAVRAKVLESQNRAA